MFNRATYEKVKPREVEHAHVAENGPKQLGRSIRTRSDQRASIRDTVNGRLRRSRQFALLLQVFGRMRKVFVTDETVLPNGDVVPFFAILATASDTSHRDTHTSATD
jgi:hypothetical protein